VRVYNAKLKCELEIPEGWYLLEAGPVREGDQAWQSDGEGAEGEFGPVAIYNLGHDSREFWCVIRAWNDGGRGI
jgi:hypothetical protein